VFAGILLICAADVRADKTIFEDNFDDGLSEKWEVIGLSEDDYRIRDGALELRVQSGGQRGSSRMIRVLTPIHSDDTVIATVRISPLQPFTEPEESASLSLLAADGPEFTVAKKYVDRKLVYTPGQYQFIGRDGEEGDSTRYTVTYTQAADHEVPVRIIADRGTAFHQVGPFPDQTVKYKTFFMSAIQDSSSGRGFCLMAEKGPEDTTHWVRFDDFRVFYRN
jgi:hypothetical protein